MPSPNLELLRPLSMPLLQVYMSTNSLFSQKTINSLRTELRTNTIVFWFLFFSLYGKEKFHSALLWSPGIHSELPLLSCDSSQSWGGDTAGRASPPRWQSRKWLGCCALENARNFPIVPSTPLPPIPEIPSLVIHSFPSLVFEVLLFCSSLLNKL